MTARKPLTIRLNTADSVVVARIDLVAGTKIPEKRITCIDPVSRGHKVEVASGQRTKSELNGIGDNEFVPWALGAVM